jgi:hypothetical protein
MIMDEDLDIAGHILSASANLLGFSFIVLTAVRELRIDVKPIAYELPGLAVGLFTLSCLMSFLAIRNGRTKKGMFYTKVADYVFLLGLGLLFLTAALLEFKIL